MVKTRQQKMNEERNKKTHDKKTSENKVETRSSSKLKLRMGSGSDAESESGLKLECIELPKIVIPKKMNERFKLKKAIAKHSNDKKIQKDIDYLKKNVKHLKKLYKKDKKQNNEEMLAVWKNLSYIK